MSGSLESGRPAWPAASAPSISSPSCGILSPPSVHPHPPQDPKLHPPLYFFLPTFCPGAAHRSKRHQPPSPPIPVPPQGPSPGRSSLTLSFWKEWRKLPPSSPSSLGVPGGLLMPLMLFGEFCRRWRGEAVSRALCPPKHHGGRMQPPLPQPRSLKVPPSLGSHRHPSAEKRGPTHTLQLTYFWKSIYVS